MKSILQTIYHDFPDKNFNPNCVFMLIKTSDLLICSDFMEFPVGVWHQHNQPVQGREEFLMSLPRLHLPPLMLLIIKGSDPPTVRRWFCVRPALPSDEGPCSCSASPWCTRRHHLLCIPGLLGVSCLSSSDIVTRASRLHESSLDSCPGGSTPPRLCCYFKATCVVTVHF